MKKQIGIYFMTAAMVVQTCPTFLWADAPGKMYYSGQLTGADATFSGSKAVTFSIWDAASAGNQLYSEFQPAVPVNNGAFTALIGANNPVPATIMQSSPLRWLEIDVIGESPTPRLQLGSAAYALSVPGISVDANNNVGVGTPNPASRLSVSSIRNNMDLNKDLWFSDDTSGNAFIAQNANSNGPFIDYVNNGPGSMLELTSSFARLSALPAGTAGSNISQIGYIYIPSSTGNVGVGTTVPNAKLQIHGGDIAVDTPGSGIILKATDDPTICFRITVNSAGTLNSGAAVSCP